VRWVKTHGAMTLTRLVDEIKDDLQFIQSHSLQPKWYKILKVFILLGFLLGYNFLFGFLNTVLFFAIFVFLMAIVHLTYRVKTNKWKQSWLDFAVYAEGNEMKTKRIGIFYYSAIIVNAILSFVTSQALSWAMHWSR
jgi:hypothetical protein